MPSHFILTRKAKILEKIRILLQLLFRSVNPFFYVTLVRAHSIVMISESNRGHFPFWLVAKSRFRFEHAIGINYNTTCQDRNRDRTTVKLISVGRLVYFKGFHLALYAFAKTSKRHRMELSIVGGGMEKKNLCQIASASGDNGNVLFVGGVSRQTVLRMMSEANIFIFPSFEGAGMVVLEAMASGLPVICLEYGGPGEMVTDECGIKVKPTTPEQTIKELSEAIMLLANDPDLRRKMGEAGRKRVEEFYTWEKKGEFIQKLYREVMESESPSRS
jgi:glycosyltransferase involved in cell wall biosynthesis